MNKIVENIKKYVYYTINTLIIIFAILTIYYMFQTTILKKQYANMFGYTAFRVATGSMESEINIGDVIVVKLTDKVNIGEVIVFEQDSSLIVHRLIKQNGDKYITKGDANNLEDEPITKERIKGKVQKVIPSKLLIQFVICVVVINFAIYFGLGALEKRGDKSISVKGEDIK